MTNNEIFPKEKIDKCLSTVTNLFEKYKDEPYMLHRIYNHIFLYLPNTLENEHKVYEKRQNLNAHLNEEQYIFMQVFLSKNNYYYLPNNNFYYEYNGLNYFIVKDDDIIHKLLSAISKDRTLLKWKHKTKISIIKQIKDRNLFSSIPETDTIQNVLNNLYPSIFTSKNFAKYFLTIIGDNILKKNTDNDLIFLCSSKFKQLLDELENVGVSSIGISNISNKFITKYHETHSFTNCRLIKFNENVFIDYWREILNKIGLNLLCVAVHYSNRYNNSENFLKMLIDDETGDYVCSLKNTTQNGLIDKFIEQYIQKTSNELTIEWKNIHFIWKQFLSNNNLPNVVFSNTLKTILKTHLQFNEDSDSFIGVTSKHLPVYKDFIQFWNDTITYCDCDDFENDLEIDEINSLFKLWSKSKNINAKHFLTEETIIKILQHFFSLEIIDNKFILNIISTNWNKINDIKNSMLFIKTEIINNGKNNSLISFEDLYNYYNKYCVNKQLKLIISKRFFEKYILHYYVEYIMYDKFININLFDKI